MDDEARKLLVKHGVLVLPEYITHDTYALVLEALLECEGQEMNLYCRGDGGSSRAALAIVDLVQQHGRVNGILPSEANSSHAIIFAGCPQRYVYPRASIGLHKVAFESGSTRVDSQYAQLIAQEYEAVEHLNADILAAASNKPARYWYDIIQSAGSAAVIQFDAAKLIEFHMAQPIAALSVPPKAAPITVISPAYS